MCDSQARFSIGSLLMQCKGRIGSLAKLLSLLLFEVGGKIIYSFITMILHGQFLMFSYHLFAFNNTVQPRCTVWFGTLCNVHVRAQEISTLKLMQCDVRIFKLKTQLVWQLNENTLYIMNILNQHMSNITKFPFDLQANHWNERTDWFWFSR